MRCPKCHYVSFDGQNRCRNCGYDLSLAQPSEPLEVSTRPGNPTAAPLANLEPEPLPLPRASEQTLTRARSLFARGHLHEALQTLSAVAADDPLRRDADTLLIEVERALLDSAGVRAGSPPRPSPLSER